MKPKPLTTDELSLVEDTYMDQVSRVRAARIRLALTCAVSLGLGLLYWICNR